MNDARLKIENRWREVMFESMDELTKETPSYAHALLGLWLRMQTKFSAGKPQDTRTPFAEGWRHKVTTSETELEPT